MDIRKIVRTRLASVHEIQAVVKYHCLLAYPKVRLNRSMKRFYFFYTTCDDSSTAVLRTKRYYQPIRPKLKNAIEG
jgi:hypothetical protein